MATRQQKLTTALAAYKAVEGPALAAYDAARDSALAAYKEIERTAVDDPPEAPDQEAAKP